jgi:hypothetical protein
MVKARPAVVLSPRLPHRDSLCTIVPGLSISVGAVHAVPAQSARRSLPGSVSVAGKRTRHFKSGRPRGERPDAAGVRHFGRQESIFVSDGPCSSVWSLNGAVGLFQIRVASQMRFG